MDARVSPLSRLTPGVALGVGGGVAEPETIGSFGLVAPGRGLSSATRPCSRLLIERAYRSWRFDRCRRSRGSFVSTTSRSACSLPSSACRILSVANRVRAPLPGWRDRMRENRRCRRPLRLARLLHRLSDVSFMLQASWSRGASRRKTHVLRTCWAYFRKRLNSRRRRWRRSRPSVFENGRGASPDLRRHAVHWPRSVRDAVALGRYPTAQPIHPRLGAERDAVERAHPCRSARPAARYQFVGKGSEA